jgi:transposase
MPAERVPMHKIEEILRLRHAAGLSLAQIAAALGLSKGVVAKYVNLAEARGIGWPLPAGLDPGRLADRLLDTEPAPSRFAVPDFGRVHVELKRKGTTLQLLWSEYVDQHGDRAYRYTQFCEHYRRWRSEQKRSLRQRHLAGDKLFIDYAGQTVPVVDRGTGEIGRAEVFVAVLGASNYTYAEATWTQQLPDWIGSHVRAFAYFGGVPALLVPDNLKSAVKSPDRYEPQLNDTYQELARHYGTAILPARPRKPQDKAKVEAGVLLVERWILARLRHQTFFGLRALNEAIARLLTALNERLFQRLPGSRRSHFEALDRPALKALPAAPYEYAEWKAVKVGIDYHVEYQGHFYSVPHRLVGQRLHVRVTARTLECLLNGQRLASHPRAHGHGYTTIPEHMPSAHRAHLEWSPSRFLRWAHSMGPATHTVVDWLLTNRPHPEHGYRRCLGLLSLARRYGKPRLEAACARAVALRTLSYRSVASILKQGLDQLPQEEPQEARGTLPLHDNVRGSEYYH